MDTENIIIGVVGLGYVGLPLAHLFASRYTTVGYDYKAQRIEALKRGEDATEMLTGEELKSVENNLELTSDVNGLRKCNFIVVAVPTPVDANCKPDLTPLLSASRAVGSVLKKGDIVVYESTVYPGVTEEECVPMLEKTSGMKMNQDFFVGYSPERVNPGDKVHRVENIQKITSGSTPETAETVDKVYNSVLKNGTYKASSIKVAEAAKIVENSQRDVNIAFVNELAKIFNAMGIDTHDVLDAAATKWNFIPMQPGLVGGHCIGVDPYYLIEKAQVYGVMPHVMNHARRLNDSMGHYVAMQFIDCMSRKGMKVKDAKMLVMGFSFKENCCDIRNTKVSDIIKTLSSYSDNITVWDPWVDAEEARREFGVEVLNTLEVQDGYQGVILAVAHSEFKDLDLRSLIVPGGVIYDVKGILPKDIIDARL